ncbi:MAG: hypothetical protein E6K86_02675 [Thaumarchaeota archaeon]|nr:MAG: hypothetical protein E6K86_02675 [Nitrososphaerota archaeon]
MKNRVPTAVIILVVVGSGGIGYLAGFANQRTVTSVLTTTALGSTTTRTVTLASLELLVRVTPQVASQGRNITVVAEVYNPLQTIVVVNATTIINPAQGPCGQNSATGVRVYSGHFTSFTLSGATPLLLYNASLIPPCPAIFSFVYTFQPNSDNATVQALPPFPTQAETRLVNETTTLSGYWVNCCLAGPGASYMFQKFHPGQYTVVVFDEWGQQIIEYFEVT